MSIEFQVSAKGVRNDNDEHGNAIFHIYPLLNYLSTERWQVVEEMAVSFEDTPKLSGHRKDDSRIGNVRKHRLLIFEPEKCSPISATGAESRFAPVVATFFFIVGGVHFPA